MFARVLSNWYAVKASYWFYPALFSVAAFALAMALVHADRTGAAQWLSRVEVIEPSRPDGASNMLTVLAGSMIGVASTVFSITIAAVAYASGTYGPRLLTNFMEDKGNQLSLATFIGTFVYAITVLRTVRTHDEISYDAPRAAGASLPGFVPQLSLLVAFAMMMISIGVLVYFLHHIPSSIRINAVLEGIGKRLLAMIRDRFPQIEESDSPRREPPGGAAVASRHTGYVRLIDFEGLAEQADKAGVTIGMAIRAGDFVHEGMPLAYVADGADEELAREICACFALGGARTPEQDLEFSIDEIVEIALRALSPGINDPFTAITAVHWLGAATAELGRRDLHYDPGAGDPRHCRIVPLPDDFAHFVRRGFGAARSALADNRLAAVVGLDTLRKTALLIDDHVRRDILLSEGDLLMAQAECRLSGPDIASVREHHASFRAAFAGMSA